LSISFDLSNFVIATTATYNCSAGYTLVGSSTRQCNALHQWTGSAPTCTLTANWCPVIDPVSSDVTGLSDGSLTYENGTRRMGDVAEAFCPAGSTLEGDAVRTCQIDQTWSGQDASCAYIVGYCPWINSTHYQTNYSDSNLYINSTVTISCPAQFNLEGNAILECFYSNDTNGRWNLDIPDCQPVPTESEAHSVSASSIVEVSLFLIYGMLALLSISMLSF